MNLLTKYFIGLIWVSLAVTGCDAEFREPASRRPWTPPTQTFTSYYPVFQYTTPGLDYPGESSPRSITSSEGRDQSRKILQLDRIDKANAIYKKNGRIFLINANSK